MKARVEPLLLLNGVTNWHFKMPNKSNLVALFKRH